jgi:flagellar basal body rod protein FlgG
MKIYLPGLKQAMKDQFDRNNIVANNLANINTIGFKKDNIFFRMLEEEIEEGRNTEQITDFSQGYLEETNNHLDIAISGKGFFTLETEDGFAYTREGHFTLDEDGILRTTSGLGVMGKSGLISLRTDLHEPDDIVITQNGEILVDEEEVGELLIFDFENEQSLKKIGSNLFVTTDNSVGFEVYEPILQQGFLERSNVNPAQEMIDLISIQRQFESVQRMVRTMDEIFNHAVNKLGRY